MSIKYNKYLLQKKEIQETILEYLYNNDDEESNNFNALAKLVEKEKIAQNIEELTNFLRLISSISNNHHQKADFFTKIEKILNYLLKEKNNKLKMPKIDIFKTFINNKKILYILFKHEIIRFEEPFLDYLQNEFFNNNHEKLIQFYQFFLPEIKKFIDKDEFKRIKQEIITNEQIDFENYEELRSKGENPTKISLLIRNDSIDEFIPYITRNHIKLKSKISKSIFETNSFLIDKTPSLIEYAAFFGSIQNFKYLHVKEVKLKPSLWIYAIHSNNPELFSYLEEQKIEKNEEIFEKCYLESIKCHHNEMADYIKENLLNENNDPEDLYCFIEKVVSYSIKYSNYLYFPKKIDSHNGFYFLCRFYLTLINLFFKKKKTNLKT